MRTDLIGFIAVAFVAAALGLPACGDDPKTSSGSHEGTAAIGAPISGASVSGTCADGSSVSGTTAADGTFGLDVATGAAPCALTLSGGNVRGAPNGTTLHSVATAAGVVNITPLTELALARAVNDVTGQALATWASAPTELAAVAAELPGASDALRAALTGAGYPIPASWSAGGTAPFTTVFVASPGSDPFDFLLEAVAMGIDDAGLTLATLVSTFADGSALPEAPEDLPEPPDPTLTGTGTALNGADGATGTLNGTTHTFSTSVQWGYLPQNGVDVGSFRAYGPGTGGFDPLTSWLIGGFPAKVGTYHCEHDGPVRIQLVVAGVNHDTAPMGSACMIEVTSISPSAVTGRFSATLVDMTGAVAGTVTDGYFVQKVDNGGGQALPDGEVGASFDMDGQTWRYEGAFSLAFEGFAGLTAAPAAGPGAPLGIQIHSVPNELGTYTCDSDPEDNYRQLNIWFVWDFVYHHAGVRASLGVGPAGSSCRVTVTKVGSFTNGAYVGTFEGTFEGTFVSNDLASTKVVTNGRFRLIGAP